ncbi:hypothetical protein EG68_12153 [Paragonimus skrjabini miyazakii]|uniref:Uncharacterized protein n=1 Tax=Paragonimus skrjabini miyazakii TaxID=59628 RepID=A0A8S9YGM2_9TREM|nr:hypothetical protein EG68_12153 [Paragonimus skrjabini miyazakii]
MQFFYFQPRMRRNYYQDLRSLIRSDHYSRLRTLLLVVTLFLALVLFHVALDTLKEEKNIANPTLPDESFRKAIVSVNSHAEQNREYRSGPVNISDKMSDCSTDMNQSENCYGLIVGRVC